MKVFLAAVLLLFSFPVFAQDKPATDDFFRAVQEGLKQTDQDEAALRLRELVRQIEITGAFQDGEFEGLETLLGVQETTEETAPAQVYGDE